MSLKRNSWQGRSCHGLRSIGPPWRLMGIGVRLPPTSPIGETRWNPAVRHGPGQAPPKVDGGNIPPLFRRSLPAFFRRWTWDRVRLSDEFGRRHMHGQGLRPIIEVEGRRQVELKDWLGLLTPATILGTAVFIWRVLARSEDRITANADKAHAAIGERIGALDNKVDGVESRLNQRIDALDNNLNGKIDGVESRLNSKIDGVESRLDHKVNAVDNKVSDIKDKLAETREDVAVLKAHIVTPRTQDPRK